MEEATTLAHKEHDVAILICALNGGFEDLNRLRGIVGDCVRDIKKGRTNLNGSRGCNKNWGKATKDVVQEKHMVLELI